MCVPRRRGGALRGWVGLLLESGSGTGLKEGPTGGARASATERDRRVWQFGPGTGPAEVGCVGEKERKEGRD